MGKKSPPRFQQRKNEFAELDQVYNKASKKPKKKKGAAVVIIICILALLVVGAVAGWMFLSDDLEDGIIMENITVANVNIGGMTEEEAVQVLENAMADVLTANPMVVVISDQQVTLTPEVTEVRFDAAAAVEEAYALGRTGSRSERKEQQLMASTTGITIDAKKYLYINTDAVIGKLNELGLNTTGDVVQTTWEVVGDLPDLTAEEPPVENQTLVIHMGMPVYAYDQNAVLTQILEAYVDGAYTVEVVCETHDPDPVDLDALYEQYYTAPVDAVMDQETFEVTPHSYGYGFNLETGKQILAQAEFGADVAIPFEAVAPAQTQQALEGLLFRDVLAKHTATGNSSYNRNNNLKVACKAIDGTIIMPGEIFDYNETTGQRTTEKGYLPADGYAGDETVKMVGGGVCQPSSIIYYCALLADMEIVTRSCHRFISSYMDPGMDATVSWGGPHFRFRNNTDYPIRIDASASGASVTIALVGTDTKDYYVKMEYEIVSKRGWSVEYVEMKADNEDGYKDGEVISTPYTGYTVNTYRCRYRKSDDSLIEKVFEAKSVYDSRNKKIAKIIAEETDPTQPPVTDTTNPPVSDPTNPPVTDPPATNPPVTDPPATTPPVTDPPAPPVEESGA